MPPMHDPNLQLPDLPDELLLHVISFLDPISLLSLHATSRRLSSLSRSNAALWRTHCLSAAESAISPASYTRSADLASVASAWPHAQADWYHEYRFRQALLRTTWLSPSDSEAIGLTGVTCPNTHKDLLIVPDSAGTVNIWTPNSPTRHARSRRGLLAAPAPPPGTRQSTVIEPGDSIVACAAADRVYVAVDATLHELSLTTLQPIAETKYPFSISTLASTLSPKEPLTVGTSLTLHLHDPRTPTPSSSSSAASTTTPTMSSAPFSAAAPLFQPSPLSVLHHPWHPHTVLVSGYFACILHYDRRAWPRLANTMHSGASSICSLAAAGPDCLVAAGAYRGRGTLESFGGLGTPDAGLRVKNRESASYAGLLSVQTQGARVVAGGADGGLAWWENDCRYLVRRESPGDPDARVRAAAAATDGMSSWSTGEQAKPMRKVLVFDNGAPVGMWVGKRVGVFGPWRARDSGLSEEEEEEEEEEEDINHRMERLMTKQVPDG